MNGFVDLQQNHYKQQHVLIDVNILRRNIDQLRWQGWSLIDVEVGEQMIVDKIGLCY